MTFPASFPAPRLALLLAALAVAGAAVHARADDPLPKPVSPDRYNKMAAHSPFAPPTEAPRAQVAAATPPPGPSWSDKLTANMITQVGGVFYVTVVDPDSTQHLYLSTDAVDQMSQLKVSSVEGWNPAEGNEEPKITLLKGTQFGVIRYEPGASGGMGAAPRGPGMPVPNNNFRPNQPPTSVPTVINQGPSSAIRPLNRGPIRAVPAPAPAAGGTGRPIVLPGENRVAPPARPGPQVKTDDDDDDDD